MTAKALDLLERMVEEYDKSNRNTFDSMFYLGYQPSVIYELESSGFILCKNDIIGSIVLTKHGYQEVKG